MIKYFCLLLLGTVSCFATSWLHERREPGDFPLFHAGAAAQIYFATDDFKVVELAAQDLRRDVARVTDISPVIECTAAKLSGPAVIIGALGHSPLIDELVRTGKLDVSALRGQWESFVITTISDPLPGVSQGLIIVGSDRRGAAFGVYELSQAIGVSPWYWWADVTPVKKDELSIAGGTRRFGPPSVQYRGIFINDEDWGLQPWAAKTFEPETGDIGPKTYAKICELLLRLKANTLWPAMHACTKAFDLYPQNKIVADDYAIVMGSSHAEPMLRNNVTEWTAPPATYNYVTNRDGVRTYWEQRVKENGRFENIYTLGMRGIHDSHMQGPKTDAERISTLEQIFSDQRAMLAKYANPSARRVIPDAPSALASIPQIFCAYKEVLDLYRLGLKVPGEVTIVWPDDNFGYIRNFASEEERKRSGGFGIYYHLSYLGAPLSYLWLEATPPALILEEMHKAYDYDARKIWIANVGDLKPGEIDMEFFLQMAWDIKRWDRTNLTKFLPEWAEREFGTEHSSEIAAVIEKYYRLNFARRPEHLQWWMPGRTPAPSPLSETEITARLEDFSHLRLESERIASLLPVSKRDAFEELVGYPVRGSALANIRYFQGERGDIAAATTADSELKESTRRFNEQLADGKWNHILSLEPADNQWKSMRLSSWKAPEFVRKPGNPTEANIIIPAENFAGKTRGQDWTWEVIAGLGVGLFPTSIRGGEDPKSPNDGIPRLDYEFNLPVSGPMALAVQLLPVHPAVSGGGLRLNVSLDEQPSQLIVCDVKDGSIEWAQGVLNNFVTMSVPLQVSNAGKHTLHLHGTDAGVVIEKLVISQNLALAGTHPD